MTEVAVVCLGGWKPRGPNGACASAGLAPSRGISPCSIVVELLRKARVAGLKGSVARVHSQTGVTPKAQTGNVFPQILMLVPEISPFVIYSTGFSTGFVFFCFVLMSPLYKCQNLWQSGKAFT